MQIPFGEWLPSQPEYLNRLQQLIIFITPKILIKISVFNYYLNNIGAHSSAGSLE